ncbi:hypothetical protein L0128_21470 [candidate division KSB1 bacterium]|nr:hypothetical protein [candidate division KSB1 bacterium]
MHPQTLIPEIDPNPLPGPFWLFEILLLATFLLHLLAMNFLLGGGVLALIAKWRSQKNEYYARLFADLCKKLPNLLPATITLGVAPLLFEQVLFGQYFYTSSIILGWPWFFVLILLTLAYYGFYLVAFKHTQSAPVVNWILLLSVVCIFLIGFIYSNNFTLLETPQKWSPRYLDDPSGWNLNLDEMTLYPRYFHFFSAALAIGGLFVAAMGLFRWKKEPEYARFLIKWGGNWFMYLTMLQFIIGIWFLISLPRARMLIFMGDDLVATAAFLISMVTGLGAIFLMSNGLRRPDPRPFFYLAAGLTLITLIFMIIMRYNLRLAYLKDYFQPADFVIKTQWEVLPLFLVLFVAGIGLWVLMLRRFPFAIGSNSK